MNTPQLGWIVLYVDDVTASVDLYVRAFGLVPRFTSPDGDYAELETGATALALCDRNLAASSTGLALERPAQPWGNVTLVVDDVPAAFQRAVDAGATPVAPAHSMPWGQVVSYVLDPDGHLVELATAVSG